MLALPSQTPGLVERHGLTRAEADRSVWAFDQSGRRYQGAAAINRALQLLGPPWATLARLYFALAPARWQEDRVYDWVAAHRPLLDRLWSDPPACGERTGTDR